MDFKRLSGILMHPTSFPGKYGIGDLGKEAYEFIDFLYKANQRLWQILPINPTSFGDSPYQSFSTFAGNPLLISLDCLVEEKYLKEEDLEKVPEFDPALIDYGKVISYKYELFERAYANFKNGASKKQKDRFKIFCGENEEWLDDFCLFVSVKNYFIEERRNTLDSNEYKEFKNENKDKLSKSEIDDYFYGAVWSSWPKELIVRETPVLENWHKKLFEKIEFQKFLQYEFFREWNLLKKYANDKDVKIIGDIPIFAALDSADVWAHKHLFLLDEYGQPTAVAGVPPDYFSEFGQLWGNPLYDWDEHKKTDYKWWIERIKLTLKKVDILRIDHFRGFDSYWEIPYGEKTAVKGKWKKGPGRSFFAAVEKALGKLPIIAEDLGIITEDVEKLRDSLNFPGMKVLQFGFDAGSNNLNMTHNIKTSNVVVYTGTHDNTTTIDWYMNTNDEIKDQFRRYMNVSGEDPAWDLLRLAFYSVAVMVIVPIQDILRLDGRSRMNTPGVAEGNWRFRYNKELLTDKLAEDLRYFSKLTDRNLKD